MLKTVTSQIFLNRCCVIQPVRQITFIVNDESDVLYLHVLKQLCNLHDPRLIVAFVVFFIAVNLYKFSQADLHIEIRSCNVIKLSAGLRLCCVGKCVTCLLCKQRCTMQSGTGAGWSTGAVQMQSSQHQQA